MSACKAGLLGLVLGGLPTGFWLGAVWTSDQPMSHHLMQTGFLVLLWGAFGLIGFCVRNSCPRRRDP